MSLSSYVNPLAIHQSISLIDNHQWLKKTHYLLYVHTHILCMFVNLCTVHILHYYALTFVKSVSKSNPTSLRI